LLSNPIRGESKGWGDRDAKKLIWAVMGCRGVHGPWPEEKKGRRMPNGATVVFSLRARWSHVEQWSTVRVFVRPDHPYITIHGRKGGRSSESERAKEHKGDSREKRQGELVLRT